MEIYYLSYIRADLSQKIDLFHAKKKKWTKDLKVDFFDIPDERVVQKVDLSPAKIWICKSQNENVRPFLLQSRPYKLNIDMLFFDTFGKGPALGGGRV